MRLALAPAAWRTCSARPRGGLLGGLYRTSGSRVGKDVECACAKQDSQHLNDDAGRRREIYGYSRFRLRCVVRRMSRMPAGRLVNANIQC